MTENVKENVESPLNKGDKFNFSLSNESILISLFSIISYLASYKYENGFINFYKIPDYFIEISITDLLRSAIYILSFFITIIIFSEFISIILNKDFEKYSIKFKILIIINIYFTIYLLSSLNAYWFTYDFFENVWFLLFFYAIYFIFPLIVDKFFKKDKSSFEDRAVRSIFSDHKGALYYLCEILGFKLYILIIVFIPSLNSIAYNIGYSKARTCKEYLYDKNKEVVLVKKVNNSFILKKINYDKQQLYGNVKIVSNDDISSYDFESVKFDKITIMR